MILGALNNIHLERSGRRKRSSSYDETGGNRDYKRIEPGAKCLLLDVEGPGIITHIWCTLASYKPDEKYLYRRIVIRMFWDGEDEPSVEVPIGDFFGMGHGIVKNFVSAPLQMSPAEGKALNCFFPMPFARGARIEVENQSENRINLYYYVDYEEHDAPPETRLRFHAFWNREITDGIDDSTVSNAIYQFGGKNTTGEGNYVILEAEGKGHYVGCNVNIHNLRFTRESNWYGEGDDMIFIDGEPWPPSLHGTGTEDYFNTAWCPQEEYNAPYHGIILGGGPNWSGKVTFYRYHIQDPVMFEKSIKVTIEHGHNNHRSDDWSSTAYWYQTEPHKPMRRLPAVEERLPLDDILPFNREDLLKCFDY